MNHRLLKSSLVISVMTLISRVLGLVRDVVIAHLMGAGVASDVFFFANKIPNFLRRLFAEGAFAQAFVPVFTESHVQDDLDKTRDLIAKVSGTLGLIVTVVTLLGVIGSSVVTAIFGTGWFIDWLHNGPDGHKFVLASFLLKITFPYLWFITFVAMSGSILNSIGKFSVAAFTPVLLNIAMISSALWLAPQMQQPEIGLAIGIFSGGLLQFLFQLPFLKKAGFLVKPKWGWHDAGVTKIRLLMLPAIFGVSVSQINLLLDTFIASFLKSGSISWLYYSERLLEFPLGMCGIAIATVILPALSRKHVTNDSHAFTQTLDWGVRMVMLLGLPAMMAVIILAPSLLMVLFMHGQFGVKDVMASSYSLWAYSAGLINFMMIKIFAPGFYARQDTKTPVRYAIIAMISNMGFNLLLVPFFGYIGLALASTISSFVNMAQLYLGLRRDGIYCISKETMLFLIKITLSTVGMGMMLYFFLPHFDHWLSVSLSRRIIWLVALISAGIVSYFALLFLFGVRLSQLRAHS